MFLITGAYVSRGLCAASSAGLEENDPLSLPPWDSGCLGTHLDTRYSPWPPRSALPPSVLPCMWPSCAPDPGLFPVSRPWLHTFVCKKPARKHFRLCRPYGLSGPWRRCLVYRSSSSLTQRVSEWRAKGVVVTLLENQGLWSVRWPLPWRTVLGVARWFQSSISSVPEPLPVPGAGPTSLPKPVRSLPTVSAAPALHRTVPLGVFVCKHHIKMPPDLPCLWRILCNKKCQGILPKSRTN